jgi:uncharacterized phage infection (PIP) family protein YhgE
MNPLEFFIIQLEEGAENISEEYNEGYDDMLQSIAYAIRSEDIRSLNELDSLIEQMNSEAEDYAGEYRKGYKDAIDRCKESLRICA